MGAPKGLLSIWGRKFHLGELIRVLGLLFGGGLLIFLRGSGDWVISRFKKVASRNFRRIGWPVIMGVIPVKDSRRDLGVVRVLD